MPINRIDRTRVNNSQMKAPGDYRPTWGGGIIQIMITRACDLSCIGCTQGSNLGGKPMIMPSKKFMEAVDSLVDYPGVVGIFGGNPTLHHNFTIFCEYLQQHRPKQLCGLWSNNLNGYGKLCRETFNSEYSNLNVHCNYDAYMEILRDWPEAHPKGLSDSRHSPPFVAMSDMHDMTDDQRWNLINNCDINQLWSAMIGVFRGELRGWFCELAGAQSMLHESELDYPDTGIKIVDGWWKRPIVDFTNQIMKHCYECGIPLRGMGDLAVSGSIESYSKTHEKIYKLKKPIGKELRLITSRAQLGKEVEKATDYIENGVL